ncbi:MAG: YybH family protein [Gemmatimonadales bacterium]
MRYPLARLAASLLIGVSGCSNGGPTELTDARRAAITDSVRTAFTRFTSALGSGDVDAAIQFYSDDPGFRWVEDGTVRYTSRGDIAEALEQLRGFASLSFRFQEPTIDVLAPTVAVLSTITETTLADTSGRSLSFTAALTVTMVRDSTGWRARSGHSSSQRPGT